MTSRAEEERQGRRKERKKTRPLASTLILLSLLPSFSKHIIILKQHADMGGEWEKEKEGGKRRSSFPQPYFPIRATILHASKKEEEKRKASPLSFHFLLPHLPAFLLETSLKEKRGGGEKKNLPSFLFIIPFILRQEEGKRGRGGKKGEHPLMNSTLFLFPALLDPSHDASGKKGKERGKKGRGKRALYLLPLFVHKTSGDVGRHHREKKKNVLNLCQAWVLDQYCAALKGGKGEKGKGGGRGEVPLSFFLPTSFVASFQG